MKLNPMYGRKQRSMYQTSVTLNHHDGILANDRLQEEPRGEKTGLRGLRPDLLQTDLNSHRSRLEA